MNNFGKSLISALLYYLVSILMFVVTYISYEKGYVAARGVSKTISDNPEAFGGTIFIYIGLGIILFILGILESVKLVRKK